MSRPEDNRYEDEIEDLRARVAELEAVLAWYADKMSTLYIEEYGFIGARARKALATQDEGGGR